MGHFRIFARFIAFAGFLIFFGSCEELAVEGPGLEKALEQVEEVVPVVGGGDVTMSVNLSNEYYFTLGLSNIRENDIIADGEGEGWCIDWEKPINSNNGTYTGIKLYSTYNVKKWNRINYLLNIVDSLRESDPELTYREIQLVIWSLRGNPVFKLDNIATANLPPRMLSGGVPNFNRNKVREILKLVEEGVEEFSFVPGTKYAVIAETPADVQTVITVVE